MTLGRPTLQDLDEIFRYHKPTEEQIVSYASIRDVAKTFATRVLLLCPENPDRTVAIRKIREAVMVANASIALAHVDNAPREYMAPPPEDPLPKPTTGRPREHA